MSDLFSLVGQRLLITGASGGIGMAIANMAAECGANVILVGRDQTALNRVLTNLPVGDHSARKFDLGDLEGIPAFLDSIVSEVGTLTGLIHAAGIQRIQPMKVLSTKVFREHQMLNVDAAFALSKAFRKKSVCPGPGTITLISSVMGLVGQPGQVAYSASKGALVSMAKSMALELARQKIRVNCVAPGLVEVGMGQNLKSTLPMDQFEEIIKMHPLGLGSAEDVASSVVFLTSSASSWITGTCIVVDGGYCAH